MTETESMVERVAKAMAKAMFANSGNEPGSMDEYLDIVAPTLFGQARAAIEAMKTPTIAMIRAAESDLVGTDTPMGAEEVVWRAMIDAALVE